MDVGPTRAMPRSATRAEKDGESGEDWARGLRASLIEFQLAAWTLAPSRLLDKLMRLASNGCSAWL
jgi:hypothetical protein